ncbi:MAG: CDP-alcohol phosphatidyltransferase family protein [Thaumarchaeota archaeon]|nr:CDP-alcohol phosphatidyltransferase family protein [Nitrososphaerota archaeon]
MLDRLRKSVDSYLGTIGRVFSRLSSSPTAWTSVGVAVSIVSGLTYATGGYYGQLFGGVLVLLSGWFDLVDGAVARVTGRTSMRGGFLDSTLDRVAEVAVYAGIVYAGYANPLVALLALSLSLLVSYTRAKGDALGVSLSGIGVAERSERLMVLALASVTGVAGWGVLVVALLAGYTFIVRVVRVARALG